MRKEKDNKIINLAWGESEVVREALAENSSWAPIDFTMNDIVDMGYTPHEGDLEVISLTRQVIKRQTGLEYKHIILSNGATGGVTLTLRAYAQMGYKSCYTEKPYFPLYPTMIESSGLKHITPNMCSNDIGNCISPVHLIDSPSNPLGKIHSPNIRRPGIPVVFDSVYHNNVYTPGNIEPISHDAACGSYSKLTGINGIRLGWIATNDDLLYDRLKILVTAEYAGLSAASFKLIKDLLIKRMFYWDQFEHGARYKLDWNRQEWSKLEPYFGGTPVNSIGMFYYSLMDSSIKKLIDGSGIIYMPGSACGDTDDFGRFNLGADNKTIQRAVKSILKRDKK